MFTLTPAVPAEFDDFSMTYATGNFHQTAQMAHFRENLGWDVHLLFLKKADEVLGSLLLAGKQGRYEVTMGPLVNPDDVATYIELLKLVSQYVKNIGGYIVELYPYSIYQTRSSNGTVEGDTHTALISLYQTAGWKHKGFTREYDAVANRWVFVKDLSELTDAKELLASYRQTTRQTINKLQTADYSIHKLSYDELAVAKDLMDSSSEKNEVKGRDLAYFQQLYTSFGDNIEFLVVYYKNKTPISTGVFIRHLHEMVYFMSGADTEYRHLYGGHFLQHFMMTRCIEEGIYRYNFYGVSGHFAHNPLLVYKSGFRGHIEEYVGGFTYVTNKNRYLMQKAKRAAGKAKRTLTKVKR